MKSTDPLFNKECMKVIENTVWVLANVVSGSAGLSERAIVEY
jgi:hypothetical protein